MGWAWRRRAYHTNADGLSSSAATCRQRRYSAAHQVREERNVILNEGCLCRAKLYLSISLKGKLLARVGRDVAFLPDVRQSDTDSFEGTFMKQLLLIVFAFVPCLAGAQSAVISGSDRPLVFRHVTVIDAVGGPPRRDMTVIIDGSRITALGSTGRVHVPGGARTIDGSGKFLIPGLWDMHVHIFNHAPLAPPNEYYFPFFIANGVTGVREMWTRTNEMVQVREWRKRFVTRPGTVPRIGAVGTLVDGVPAEWPNSDTVSAPAQARAMVTRIRESGADFVKVYSNLSRDVFYAIASEAKAQGIPFAGHVPRSMNPSEVAEAGQKSIEHLLGIPVYCSSDEERLKEMRQKDVTPGKRMELIRATYDEKKCAALFARFVQLGTWQVPTFSILNRAFIDTGSVSHKERMKYLPGSEKREWAGFHFGPGTPVTINSRAAFEMQKIVVAGMNKVGVQFLAGTDVGNAYIVPGFSLHDELRLFVEAGLTPMQALQSATRNPARFLGASDSLGTIEKGKLADLVLLDANPLKNIDNTRKISAVVVNGKYLSRATLKKLLESAALSPSPAVSHD